jgi:hypothetical protein
MTFPQALMWRSGIWAPGYRFAPAWRIPGRSNAGILPLFSISGCGHGGTTLLATILGAHPSAHLFDRETKWFLGLGPLALLRENKARRAMAASNFSQETRVLIEKTPRHVFRIPHIRSLFPSTRFVVLVRDPRDLVASISKRIGDWKGAMVRVSLDFVAINRVKNDPDVLIIRYEDLVRDFQKTMAKVSAHLGIEFDQRMANHSEFAPTWFNVEKVEETDGAGKKAHVSRRAWQVQQPLFDGSGRYRKDLTPEQIADVESAFGALVHDFYPQVATHGVV